MEWMRNAPVPEGFLLNEAGELTPYHEGQWRAWRSEARFVFVYAGAQGGKTTFGPGWLAREVLRGGAGDYLAATATYDLFKLKMLPALLRLFVNRLRIGRYWPGLKLIELAEPSTLAFQAHSADDPMWGRIILRSAQSEGGLESATAKAAWLDECGLKEFGIDSWEAVQRRMSIHRGRVLGTTTLYNRGWTKSEIYDRWRAGNPEYQVVQFPSYENPAFPREEYERIAATLPKWKVNMFYRGEFDVPEGLIYAPFDSTTDTCDPFPIPDDWMRWGGADFGGVHQAGVCFAERPSDGHLFLTTEYLEGGRTARDHAAAFQTWRCKRWWGGAPSEDQWRREFGACGLPILEPLSPEVEVGIDIVYGLMVEKSLTVFNTCKRWLDEVGTYTRVVGPDGKPTEKIQDKETFHLLDATRYVIGSIRRRAGKAKVVRLGG